MTIEKLKTAIISKGFLEAWADIEDEELKGELDKIESELKMLIEQNPEDVKLKILYGACHSMLCPDEKLDVNEKMLDEVAPYVKSSKDEELQALWNAMYEGVDFCRAVDRAFSYRGRSGISSLSDFIGSWSDYIGLLSLITGTLVGYFVTFTFWNVCLFLVLMPIILFSVLGNRLPLLLCGPPRMEIALSGYLCYLISALVVRFFVV